jgi:Zn-dependent protease with chaperone function
MTPPVYGRFFDGEGGLRLDVALTLDKGAETLRLEHPDLPHGSQYWPLAAIRQLPDQARTDQAIYCLYDDGALDSALIATARLTVSDAGLRAELDRLCRNLTRRDLRPGTFRKVLTYSVGAVGAVLLMLFVILPGLAASLAPMIPMEREVRYGKAVIKQMDWFLGRDRNLTCRNEEGSAALEAMTTRLLSGTETQYDLTVLVFDHRMVNAFAAPGGQVVIMRGLIDKAEGPDEVAAVLAHEIGHVESRDVTRNALRAAGSAGLLSLVLGDFSGGAAVVVAAEFMLSASYTREAETAADDYALAMLDAANVDASAMGSFFRTLGQIESRAPDLPEYLRSHPKTQSRADKASEFANDQGYTRPVISDAQWAALKEICTVDDAKAPD